MPVLSRTHVAAACAGLSTLVVAGMAAVAVLAGEHSCDLAGCPPVASFAVSTAVHAVPDACAAPVTTPGSGPVERPGRERCAATPVDPPSRGGMATVRVPAP